MQQRLLTVVLLISGVLSDWPQTLEANLASAKSRAKRATAKFHQDDPETNLLQFDDHGLVLVPTTEEEVKKLNSELEELQKCLLNGAADLDIVMDSKKTTKL